MAETLRLELVTPVRRLLSEDVNEVIAPGVEGDLGILPGHTQLLTALRVGELAFRAGGHMEYVAIEGGGFLEVADDKVIILADEAELGREIDLDEAIRRKLELEQELNANRKDSDQKLQNAEIQLKRQLIRVSIAEKYKK